MDIFYRSKKFDMEQEHFQAEHPLGFIISVPDEQVEEKLKELEADPDLYDIKRIY